MAELSEGLDYSNKKGERKKELKSFLYNKPNGSMVAVAFRMAVDMYHVLN